MSGKRFNVAVIGAGIAKRHLEAFTRLQKLFDVVALCSSDTVLGQDLCKRFGSMCRAAATTTAANARSNARGRNLIS